MNTIHPHAASDKTPHNDSLLPHHLDQLTQGSGIAPEIIRARGYRSAHGAEDSSVLKKEGFSRNQSKNTPGLLIPILDCHGSPVLHQYRPDVPRVNKEGKPVKYETPWKARMRLDFGPGPHDWVGDPTIPLWITEGIKKADALRTHHLHTIALLGVWNWRGLNADGGKVVLPDWEDVALNGRVVFIAFDSDVAVKVEVKKALTRFSAYLGSKGAKVRVIALPSADGQKVGVDDYLLTHTVADLETLAHGSAISNHVPSPPLKSGGDLLTMPRARLIAIGVAA